MPIRSRKKKKSQKNVREISIKGARSNNLKNIDVQIPKNQLVVVTGLSGSGKSSLIMDTLYAEGQRRYVESLSSYARQFLDRMKKPEVDFIQGICPAIAIEQRVTGGNHRSTVGSMTEIYDYLRLLYGRAGITYSPESGDVVTRDTISDIVDYIFSLETGTRILFLSPLVATGTENEIKDRTLEKSLELLLQRGYNRIYDQKEVSRIEDFLEGNEKTIKKKMSKIDASKYSVVIDRFAIKDELELRKRVQDSVQTAILESSGECILLDPDQQKTVIFNNRFEQDGIEFTEPDPRMFNYNNPYGACPECEGYGRVLGISEQKVIPNPSLSVHDGAVACWKSEKAKVWLVDFIRLSHTINFPLHKPYRDLTDQEHDILWNGTENIWGIYDYFKELQEKTYKIQNRVLLARYRGRTTCPTCKGSRLRPDALFVKIAGKHIGQLTRMPINELLEFLNALELEGQQLEIAEGILVEIKKRLDTMIRVGLEYLTLERISSTLSGGETQRIHLTRTLGSNLTSSLYILDEPSIGLHPRDTARLVSVLEYLRNLGNTVVVVEHEEEVIRSADYLIDIGPRAGIHGGEVVFTGDRDKIKKGNKESLTLQYLHNEISIPLPDSRRKPNNFIRLNGAYEHNLKNIDAQFPLQAMTVVTGVSGSGKSTLVKDVLYPALQNRIEYPDNEDNGPFKELTGDLHLINVIEMINQKPIGKSSRSNPVTYVKAYDAIRKLMADQRLSKLRGYQPKHFSFNVDAGRCEECKGEGEITVEMQFLADIKLECDVCKGRRFQEAVLEVEYNGKNIHDILSMSIEESLSFFAEHKDIMQKMQPLFDVGLGYVQLGQSSNTLSGGEAQRVKLASYLGVDQRDSHIVFIFDEPTTGLHFHDINRLLYALNALIEKGHTVIIVEHNMDVIKCADWIIDLGPEGGKGGGELLYQGKPEGLAKVQKSYTGKYLKEKLN